MEEIQKILAYYQKNWKDFVSLKGNKLLYKNRHLKISKAPEPSDVIWTNLHYSDLSILTRRAISWIVTFFILVMSASFLVFITYE